ncbi:Ig-like domain-containing protein [Sorangium sp. So ce1128]
MTTIWKRGRGEMLGAAALTCALALGACAPEASSPTERPGGAGGEGGEGGGGGEAVDQVPPTVVSISPEDGATGVAPGEPIIIAFSEPMNEALGAVRIDPGDGVLRANAGSWSADWTTLTLAPSAPLPSGATVTLTVDVDFEDRAGNAMGARYTARFRTKDIAAPHVVAATPTEGAALVPIATEEIAITFSEPMDPAAGELVAGGDLVLGEKRWDERTVRYAVSGLEDDRDYALSLEGFRDLDGNPLDGAVFLGDGKLDFSTGADSTPPHVVTAAPAEGSSDAAAHLTGAVELKFSEPMDTTAGEATLTGDARLVPLPMAWSPDRLRLSLDVAGLLRDGAAYSVLLEGLLDQNGNPLDPAPHLEDGALDFTTGRDTLKPHAAASYPAEGDQRVYPTEIYDSDSIVSERKRLRVTFSEPMDPGVTQARLINTTSGAGRALSGTWAPDALSIELTVLPSDGADHPLDEDAFYALDLRTLRDAAGNALDTSHPYLGNGILNFKTIASDAGLNHTCQHTLFGPFESVSATAAPDGAPSTSATHTEFTIDLPSSGGEHAGYTRVSAPGGGTRVFYFDQLVPFELYDTAAMAALSLTVRPAPDACPGITHYAEATLAADVWHDARFGPVSSPPLKMVIELR